MMCSISVNRTLLVTKGALILLWTPKAWLLHPREGPMLPLAGCLSLFAQEVTAHWVTPNPTVPQLTRSQ